jgi:hypothetical protein
MMSPEQSKVPYELYADPAQSSAKDVPVAGCDSHPIAAAVVAKESPLRMIV